MLDRRSKVNFLINMKTQWSQPPDKSAVLEIYFSYFGTKTYVVGTQKNRLNETVLSSTKNTCLS